MKIAPGKAAVFFLVVTLAAFAAWIALLAYDVREDTWAAWSNAIDIIWKIIPASLVLSVVCAIAAATKKASRASGTIVLIVAVAFAVYVIAIVTHLAVR